MWTLIRFDEDDLQWAHDGAQRRLQDAHADGATDRFGADSLRSHLDGLLGEVAMYRLLGLSRPAAAVSRQYHSIGRPHYIGRYEVRTVGSSAPLYVKVAQRDTRPDFPIALVAMLAHDDGALVVGWVLASTVRQLGKLSDWGQRGAPAYMLDNLTVLAPDFPELAGG